MRVPVSFWIMMLVVAVPGGIAQSALGQESTTIESENQTAPENPDRFHASFSGVSVGAQVPGEAGQNPGVGVVGELGPQLHIAEVSHTGFFEGRGSILIGLGGSDQGALLASIDGDARALVSAIAGIDYGQDGCGAMFGALAESHLRLSVGESVPNPDQVVVQGSLLELGAELGAICRHGSSMRSATIVATGSAVAVPDLHGLIAARVRQVDSEGLAFELTAGLEGVLPTVNSGRPSESEGLIIVDGRVDVPVADRSLFLSIYAGLNIPLANSDSTAVSEERASDESFEVDFHAGAQATFAL